RENSVLHHKSTSRDGPCRGTSFPLLDDPPLLLTVGGTYCDAENVIFHRAGDFPLPIAGLIPMKTASRHGSFSMIYDITPLVSSRLAVWPGDSRLSREVLLEYGLPSPGGTGNASNIPLSTLPATVPLGAHADAPSHSGPGPAIHQRPLDLYLGPAQVMHVIVPRG